MPLHIVRRETTCPRWSCAHLIALVTKAIGRAYAELLEHTLAQVGPLLLQGRKVVPDWPAFENVEGTERRLGDAEPGGSRYRLGVGRLDGDEEDVRVGDFGAVLHEVVRDVCDDKVKGEPVPVAYGLEIVPGDNRADGVTDALALLLVRLPRLDLLQWVQLMHTSPRSVRNGLRIRGNSTRRCDSRSTASGRRADGGLERTAGTADCSSRAAPR
jgi:hypothetical protein